MSDYKVPKERARVRLDLGAAGVVDRVLFLSPLAPTHRGRETVSDLLGSPEPYLPVLEEGNGLVLLRKDVVRWVRVEEPAEVEWYFYEARLGAPTHRIRCHFAEGDPLVGILYAIAPEGEQRVSDVVNRETGFLPLETESGLYLVNLKWVTAIEVVEG
jgi:hypothetical protein